MAFAIPKTFNVLAEFLFVESQRDHRNGPFGFTWTLQEIALLTAVTPVYVVAAPIQTPVFCFRLWVGISVVTLAGIPKTKFVVALRVGALPVVGESNNST